MRPLKAVVRRGWRRRGTALAGLAALVAVVVGRADAPGAQSGGARDLPGGGGDEGRSATGQGTVSGGPAPARRWVQQDPAEPQRPLGGLRLSVVAGHPRGKYVGGPEWPIGKSS
jgi:hypothetical protein